MIQVYRNLTRAAWSVREGGKVVAHVEEIALADVRFVVQPGGRRQVLRTGQRCVHAWAEGVAVDMPLAYRAWERIDYDPFSTPAFTARPGFAVIEGADLVAFDADGKAWGTGLFYASPRERIDVHEHVPTLPADLALMAPLGPLGREDRGRLAR